MTQDNTPVNQIWLSHDRTLRPEPTKEMLSVREAAGTGYKLWLHDELRQLISDSYSPEVMWAYDRLRPFAYKSDLARLILGHRFGGWYLDLSVYRPRLINPGDNVFVGFCDLNNDHSSWKVANNYFYVSQGSSICEAAIAQIVVNCRDEYYGKDPHFPTGPSVLGRVIAQIGCDLPLKMGSYIWLRHRRNKYFFPGIGVVGRGKVGGKFRGGQSGVPGGNNYNQMWRERTVYESSLEAPESV